MSYSRRRQPVQAITPRPARLQQDGSGTGAKSAENAAKLVIKATQLTEIFVKGAMENCWFRGTVNRSQDYRPIWGGQVFAGAEPIYIYIYDLLRRMTFFQTDYG